MRSPTIVHACVTNANTNIVGSVSNKQHKDNSLYLLFFFFFYIDLIFFHLLNAVLEMQVVICLSTLN